jgi:hypothetical protein
MEISAANQEKVRQVQAEAKESTWAMVGLTLLAGPAYQMLWLYRRMSLMRRLAGKEVFSLKYLVTFGAFCFWPGVLQDAAIIEQDNQFFEQASVISWVSTLMLVHLSFLMRAAITDWVKRELGVSVAIHPALLVLFSVYYINYVLNDLEKHLQPASPDLAREQQALAQIHGGAQSATDALMRLDELLRKGAVTQAEFDAQKRSIVQAAKRAKSARADRPGAP